MPSSLVCPLKRESPYFLFPVYYMWEKVVLPRHKGRGRPKASLAINWETRVNAQGEGNRRGGGEVLCHGRASAAAFQCQGGILFLGNRKRQASSFDLREPRYREKASEGERKLSRLFKSQTRLLSLRKV